MPNRLLSLTLLFVVLISVPALADVYNNGAISGTINGWVLNFGFVTSDTFTVAPGGASVSGLSFGAWLFPGDTLNSVEVSITSAEFGGTVFFDQTVGFTASGCSMNFFGFNVCTETANFNTSLNGGTYWLNLQNAMVDNGDPVYWDQNYGPSLASENEIGTIYSEAFTINGTNNGGGTTPEATSIVLFGTGVLGMAGILRRKMWR